MTRVHAEVSTDTSEDACCGTVNLTALLKPLQHGFSHMGLALTPGQDGSLARDPTSGSLHDFAAQFAVQ